MKSFEHYKGREQTFIKHFFLENYLEKVAFNIGSFESEFVYVDGFSGPWKSSDDEYEDTSFMIALKKLRYVRDALKDRKSTLNIRCLFIEKDPVAYQELKNKTDAIDDIEVKTINGEFENKTQEIINFIGKSFSLVFIDPKGWTGYSLQKIKPILNLRGEVVINFMFDHISRFVDTSSEAIKKSIDDLGGDGFGKNIQKLITEGYNREEAILKVYMDRLKTTGNFSYVTSTRVLKPNQERTYFHLVYGTKHEKGLFEFREIERKLFEEQNKVRKSTQQRRRVESTGQSELFGPGTLPDSSHLAEYRASQLDLAQRQLDDLILEPSSIPYEKILYSLFQNEFVWKRDVNDMIKDLCEKGKIKLSGLGPRERSPKVNCDHKILRK